MKVKMTNIFKKSARKIPHKQINILENEIEKIIKNPTIGELKKGDLAGIRVHKFYIQKQLLLLAYHEAKKELILLSLSTHENFYRNLKKQI